MLSVDGNWVDPADNADNVAWVREVISQVEKFAVASGTYLNFSGPEQTAAAELVRVAMGRTCSGLPRSRKTTTPTTCSG